MVRPRLRSSGRPRCAGSARVVVLAGLLCVMCAGAGAQSVSFNGRMGTKALLVIDGQPRMLAVGASVQGVKLVALGTDEARVEAGGRSFSLPQGAPVNLGGAASAGSGREIVLSAGPGGHFFTNGTINGRSVRFLVDTGATAVAIGQPEADRLGIDYRKARQVPMNTANGTVPGYLISLSTLRIGDVDTHNVQAVVVPAPMPQVLLGNSFLTRFQMRRDADTLRLEKMP